MEARRRDAAMSRMSALEDLPPAMLEMVLGWLDWRSLLAVTTVSKHLNAAALSGALWERLFRRTWPSPWPLPPALLGPVPDWASLFQSRFEAGKKTKPALAEVAAWMVHSDAPYPPEHLLATKLPSEPVKAAMAEYVLKELATSESLTERAYAEAALRHLARRRLAKELDAWRAEKDPMPMAGVLLVHRFHFPLAGPTDAEVSEFLATGETWSRNSLPWGDRYRAAGFAEPPTNEEGERLVMAVVNFIRNHRGMCCWLKDDTGSRLDRVLETGITSEALLATFFVELMRRLGVPCRGLFYRLIPTRMGGPNQVKDRKTLRVILPVGISARRMRDFVRVPEVRVPPQANIRLFQSDLPSIVAADLARNLHPFKVQDWQRRPIWEEAYIVDGILSAHLRGPAMDEEEDCENAEDRKWKAWTELLKRRTKLGLAEDAVAADSAWGAGTISTEVAPFAKYKLALDRAKSAAAKEAKEGAKRRGPRAQIHWRHGMMFRLGQLVRLAGKPAVVRGWNQWPMNPNQPLSPPKYLLLVDERGKKTTPNILKDPQYTRGFVAQADLVVGNPAVDADVMLNHRRIHRYFHGFNRATGRFLPLPELANLYPG